MMATSLMMASLRQSKKSLSGWPCSLMLPMIRPKHMENTTRPRALIPFTDPGTDIISSRVISWLPLSENMVSFTVIFTWTTFLAYCVLYWNRPKKENALIINHPHCVSDISQSADFLYDYQWVSSKLSSKVQCLHLQLSKQRCQVNVAVQDIGYITSEAKENWTFLVWPTKCITLRYIKHMTDSFSDKW